MKKSLRPIVRTKLSCRLYAVSELQVQPVFLFSAKSKIRFFNKSVFRLSQISVTFFMSLPQPNQYRQGVLQWLIPGSGLLGFALFS